MVLYVKSLLCTCFPPFRLLNLKTLTLTAGVFFLLPWIEEGIALHLKQRRMSNIPHETITFFLYNWSTCHCLNSKMPEFRLETKTKTKERFKIHENAQFDVSIQFPWQPSAQGGIIPTLGYCHLNTSRRPVVHSYKVCLHSIVTMAILLPVIFIYICLLRCVEFVIPRASHSAFIAGKRLRLHELFRLNNHQLCQHSKHFLIALGNYRN